MIKKQIQILHISDIHLDNEIGSGKEKSAAQIGLESSIDAATENNVGTQDVQGWAFLPYGRP